jgi:hypothetical protein
MRRSLYKYFPRLEWAESFLAGELLFRSLAYFQSYEDESVRGDNEEGTATYKPDGGLVIYNQTQQRTQVFPNTAFKAAAAKLDDIFVFCVSLTFSEELRKAFGDTCVEIRSIQSFVNKIRRALPPGAKLFNRPVRYCKPTDPPENRWALPDLIATAKPASFDWQCEYRFGFSLTDALGFEKVALRLTSEETTPRASPPDNPQYILPVGDLRHICAIRAGCS